MVWMPALDALLAKMNSGPPSGVVSGRQSVMQASVQGSDEDCSPERCMLDTQELVAGRGRDVLLPPPTPSRPPTVLYQSATNPALRERQPDRRERVRQKIVKAHERLATKADPASEDLHDQLAPYLVERRVGGLGR